MKPSLFLAVCVLFLSCKDLSHDNPLDPKNPNGKADQVVVVENFIIKNTKTGITAPPYNTYSQNALYTLTDVFGGNMVILEYHMIPTDTAFADSLGTADNEFRYNNEYKGGANRGFPHTFFNGRQLSIQGASNQDLVRSRYQTILDSATAANVALYCYAEQSINGNTLTVETQLVRYGTETDLMPVRVEYVVFENGPGDLDNFTVKKILAADEVDLPAGRVTFAPVKTTNISGLNPNAVGVVIILKDPTSKKILQANRAR